MKKNYFFLSCVYFLFFITSALAAGDQKDWTLDLKTSTLIPKYAGIVKDLRGDVLVEDKTLQKGSKVYPRDIIKTEEKSFIKIELIDETLITLGPKSEFQIEQWNYRTKHDRDALFYLMRGKMRAEVKAKAKERDQLKIKSPLVAMGIRGTEVLLNNTTIGKKEISQIALLEGKINLLLLELKEQLNLLPGDYLEVIKGMTTQKKNRVLTEEEKKTFGAPQLPDQYSLLPDAIITNEGENQKDIPSTDVTSPEVTTSLKEPGKKSTAKTVKPESLKEKIKVLNQVREENRANQ